ncbi:MAG: long-chain fatty acid--CoA ligase [Parvibaculum sp.]|nr:long-chain fatty acid--CoA ligase [Parvibaculum sp.]
MGRALPGRDALYLTQPLHRAVAMKPGEIATICEDRIRTWKEFAGRVARLAGALRGLGVARGDRVAVLAMNSDRYLETCFAAYWADAVIVPMNTRWSVAEHVYSIEDADATLLLVDDAFLEMGLAIRDACPRIARTVHMGSGPTGNAGALSYEDLIATGPAIEDARRGGEELAGIFYTGGTTGFPKGVMLSHQALWTSALSIGAGTGFVADIRYLHAAPMFHLADFAMSNATSLFGGSHVFMPSFEPVSFMALMERHRASYTLLVPTMIRLLLDSPAFGKHDLSSWKGLLYGASPMAESLLREALTKLPHVAFTQGYGQTELAPIATLLGPEYHVLDGPDTTRLRSAGRPGLCVELRVIDPDGNELPRGEVGEVAVRGPNTMLGYWNKPEQTAATLVDGWVRTGDGGYVDEDGFLYIVDRLKDMIVSGGENVFSAEVENAIMQHGAVAECAVIGVPDPKWGERVHAVIVPKAGSTLTAEDIVMHCKARIAGYKCPRSADIRTEALPKSAAGKILKTDLRRPYWENQARNVS